MKSKAHCKGPLHVRLSSPSYPLTQRASGKTLYMYNCQSKWVETATEKSLDVGVYVLGHPVHASHSNPPFARLLVILLAQPLLLYMPIHSTILSLHCAFCLCKYLLDDALQRQTAGLGCCRPRFKGRSPLLTCNNNQQVMLHAQ